MERASQSADSNSDNSGAIPGVVSFPSWRDGVLARRRHRGRAARARGYLAISRLRARVPRTRAFLLGYKDWHCALQAATSGANILPEPETLGYQADAQKALGDAAGAAQTQALIFAVERIGNAYHINDRLLSVYYSEHGVRLDDSLRIAQREVARRGNEIYAQDTLAWAAAMDGRWTQARAASRLATRYHTQDSRILFHAGMIELHFGNRAAARRYLQQALALNPQWDPIYADTARTTLETLNDDGSARTSAPAR